MADLYRTDETRCVHALLDTVEFDNAALDRIASTAKELVLDVREKRIGKGGIDWRAYRWGITKYSPSRPRTNLT